MSRTMTHQSLQTKLTVENPCLEPSINSAWSYPEAYSVNFEDCREYLYREVKGSILEEEPELALLEYRIVSHETQSGGKVSRLIKVSSFCEVYEVSETRFYHCFNRCHDRGRMRVQYLPDKHINLHVHKLIWKGDVYIRLENIHCYLCELSERRPYLTKVRNLYFGKFNPYKYRRNKDV